MTSEMLYITIELHRWPEMMSESYIFMYVYNCQPKLLAATYNLYNLVWFWSQTHRLAPLKFRHCRIHGDKDTAVPCICRNLPNRFTSDNQCNIIQYIYIYIYIYIYTTNCPFISFSLLGCFVELTMSTAAAYSSLYLLGVLCHSYPFPLNK